MRPLAADARRDLPLAIAAAATTWITMLSWRGFSTLWGQYLGPLLLVAAVIVASGVLLRSASMPRRSALLLHVLIVALLVWLMIGGSLLHPVHGFHHVVDAISDAQSTSQSYQPPVPARAPSIAPLMIPCGALSLLLVDLLACWVRRVSLAGLPLLAVYCVPLSLLGAGVSWVVFLMAAAGFLMMLYLQEAAHVLRWGRPLGGAAASVDPQGFGVNTGASKASATAVGGTAVALAVLLPVLIPTIHLDGLGLFGPGGHGGTVKVVDPTITLKRDLTLGANIPLLEIHTDDPDPSYLRLSVLQQYDGEAWHAGDRAIVSDQVADGLVPLEQPKLSQSLPIRSYNYTVDVSNAFESTWLPTQFPVSDIKADGVWHWDGTTMDFLSGDGGTTAGLTYTMTAAKPEYSAAAMANSLTAPQAIESTYTQLPPSLPAAVQQMAQKVTRGSHSRYESMVMLQDWFRSHFQYNLQKHVNDPTGNDALLQFIEPGPNGREGYCQQFAGAFAIMARTLDIPARVAIGFLDPQKGPGDNEWIYRAHDMHAWPEVYFAGSGWVRFEPTPGSRAAAIPAYTEAGSLKTTPTKSAKPQGGKVPSDASSAATRQQKVDTTTTTVTTHHRTWWPEVLIGLALLAVLAAVALVPGLVRRSRRTRRLAGGAEEAWDELRDSTVDLGIGWPAGRSPHETGHLLSAWFGAEPDGPPLVRPARGRGLAPGAEDALDRIVLALEQVRYARVPHDVPGALADDVSTCIVALEHGSTRAALRRARWLPRSVFGGRRRTAGAVQDRAPEAVSAGGVIDHVG